MEAVPSTGTTTRASAAAAADFKDPSQEISAWLAKLSNFDLRHCLPAVLPGLESKVSTVSTKFDPISSLDDEFYTYTGGKDADGECHGSGAMEYDDGSYLAGAWTHGVREGHFTLSTGQPSAGCVHLEADYRGDEVAGGGCVVGDVDSLGQHSGDSIAYIYPDLSTALIGTFHQGEFVRGVAAVVTGVGEQYGCVKVPQFRVTSSTQYTRELSTLTFVTSSPLLPDPYEARMVEVRQSEVEGAEDGLFSRRAVTAGTVLAFYNGIRRPRPEGDAAVDWDTEANAYKIFDPTRAHGTVDIPPALRSLAAYTASLAHKTNHSFVPNCEFDEFHHPRFGLVPCLRALHDIGPGEEIFVWYGYDLDYCPQWYMDAWDQGNFAIPDSMKREYGDQAYIA